jgi:uncharacterized membrane protein (UPF0127 family)
MKYRGIVSAIFVAGLMATGCNGTGNQTPSPSPSKSSPPAGKAQPKLPTIKIWLGPQEMIAEQAITLPQITNGMMFRTEMAENEGMLFVFTEPHRARFWMRNTLLPLSCAYIDSSGVILEIHDMKPQDDTGIEADSDKVQYVLETKQGWFERNKIGVGTLIRTERGTLSETYFGRKEN